MKVTILSLLMWFAALSASAIIGEGYTLRVEVTHDGEGKPTFSVTNLKDFDDAAKTAKWIYELHEKKIEGIDADTERRYSNSVVFHFTKDFDQKEIARICAYFEAHGVYVVAATKDEDGRRVQVDSEADPDTFIEAVIEKGDFTPEQRELIKAQMKKQKSAEQAAPSNR